MSGIIPFFLFEAVLSLYAQGPDGQALTDQPIWSGCDAKSLTMTGKLQEFVLAASGAAFPEVFHGNEFHNISIERVWTKQVNGLRTFVPEPGQKYVLLLLWKDERTRETLARVYFGVTGQAVTVQSQGVLYSTDKQEWRAERMVEG